MYGNEDIKKYLGDDTAIKQSEYDIMKLSELRQLIEDGWVIYDTQPIVNTEDIKILTLVRCQ